MKSSRWLFGLIWLAGLVLGVVGVAERLLDGHRLAGYTSYVPWGIWVAAYIYFIGLWAGAFFLSSLIYVFDLRRLEQIGKLALFTAITTLFMALLSIWFDLGHLERFYSVFTRPNFKSMMAWMVWLYTAYFLLLLVETYYALRGDRGPLKVLGIIGIPLAIAFHGGVGALFATLIAREYWHSAIYPILFLTGALMSGGALMTALVAFFWPRRNPAWADLVQLLGRVTLGLLMLDVLLEWAEFSIPMWYRVGSEYVLMKNVLFGSHWYVFWIVHGLLGVAVPVALLITAPRRPLAVGAAAALAAVTFFAVRLNLVIPGLITPQLQGLQTAYQSHRLSYQYTPTVFEWQVLLFVVVLGIGVFYLGYRHLPLTAGPAESELGRPVRHPDAISHSLDAGGE